MYYYDDLIIHYRRPAPDCLNCNTTMQTTGEAEEAENWDGDDLIIRHFRCPACNQLEKQTIVISTSINGNDVIEEGEEPTEEPTEEPSMKGDQ